MSMDRRFKTREVVIEAIEWTGENRIEVTAFTGGKAGFDFVDDQCVIETLEGSMRADVGDMVIRGLEGEYYPCKPRIFEKKYEEIKE